MKPQELEQAIFTISSEAEFNHYALQVFAYQREHNPIYRKFCQLLTGTKRSIRHYSEIPLMPVAFFKQHQILSVSQKPTLLFTSSGTTGAQTSRHYVHQPLLYEQSFLKAFQLFYGHPQDYHILALLPGYLEREGSSLIYMVQRLIAQSQSPHSGFYLHNQQALQHKIQELSSDSRQILLLGVSYALLDMAEQYPVSAPSMIVMETGGMKGQRKELIREELHQILCRGFGVKHIHSEYGMTELLSQAYSADVGIFQCPPWMSVLIRDPNDPLSLLPEGRTGGIGVIDLANLYSCAFIATQDLGKIINQKTFSVSGRFDHSDIRGCNLMVS